MPTDARMTIPMPMLIKAVERAAADVASEWKPRVELMATSLKALRALEAYEEHAIFCENGCKGRMFVEDGCLEGLRLKTETNRLRFQAKKLAGELGL